MQEPTEKHFGDVGIRNKYEIINSSRLQFLMIFDDDDDF